MNHRSTTTYVRRLAAGLSPIAEHEPFDPELRARERLVFGLRMLAGIDEREFADQMGLTVESLVGEPLEKFLNWGLLERADHRLRLTRAGLMVSDSLWPEFLD